MHQVTNHYYTIEYEYEFPGDDEFMHTRIGLLKCVTDSVERAIDLLKESNSRACIHRMEIISKNFQGEEDAPRTIK